MRGWWSQPPAFLPSHPFEDERRGAGASGLVSGPRGGCCLVNCDTGTSSGDQSREARSREGSGRKTRRGQEKSGAEPHYADDTTLMAESEEELKRLLMKV